MVAEKTKIITPKKQKQKARNKVVPKQDINTAIMRDVKEEMNND